jgi:anti-sigma factor RsiW
MNCEQMAELLPDYLQGGLGAADQKQVQAHLAACAGCRESVAVWNKLGLLPQEGPGPELRARFDAMLAAWQEARSGAPGALPPPKAEVSWWGMGGWLRPATAMAVMLLVASFSAGRYGSRNENPQAAQELAAVRRELAGMRQLVVLAMLQQQSASERLQGVNWSAQQEPTDPKVLEALVHTLRYDSSVDVRLAALNALSRYGKQPMVNDGLLHALQPQQSPLVQMALIDLLVELRAKNAVQQLQTVQQSRDVNPAVRQRAEWALSRLN